jgi:hypothetical protein
VSNQESSANLSTQLRLAQTAFKSDLVVSLDETNTEFGWNQNFGPTLLSLDHVVAVDDRLDMLSDRRVRTCDDDVVS